MSGEKNLPATQKKIDDARKKGQVATSKDAQIVVKLFVGYAVAMGFMGMYSDQLGGFVTQIASAGMTERFHWSSDLIWAGIRVFFVITFPVVAVCALAATITTWAQIGFLVSPEAAQPSFKKLDAVQNAKQMFSKKSLLQLLLSACKVAIVAWVAYLVFKSMMNDMVYSYRGGFGELMKMMGIVLKKIIFTTLACFIVIALIDWVIERANLMKNLRMNHQDMKDEQKQTNGNPEVIKHRKKEHRNLLNSSLNQVGQSKVVVANPTHISVALDYEPGVHDVPFVVAMGVDADALAIRREATKLGIPIIVNVKLARMIYKDCEEEEYIQREHLELAAEVFRAVFQLNQSTSLEDGDSNNDK